MQFLKEKILFKPQQTQRIKFTLTADNSFTGLQENIDDFVAEQTGLSINESNDGEKYRYSPINSFNINVYYETGGTYQIPSTYEDAGFTTGETSTRDEVLLRSFYLMQVYDSTSSQNQTLLHTSYYNGFEFFTDNSNTLNYTATTALEFTDLHIINDFINTISGSTTLYGKLSFYNAKTGELVLFSPYSASTASPPALESDSDLYFEISFSADSFSYEIDTIYAYEITNDDYVDKINNTLNSFTNQKPTYPTGNTFLNTGKYIED